jgi:hypothetical protein
MFMVESSVGQQPASKNILKPISPRHIVFTPGSPSSARAKNPPRRATIRTTSCSVQEGG